MVTSGTYHGLLLTHSACLMDRLRLPIDFVTNLKLKERVSPWDMACLVTKRLQHGRTLGVVFILSVSLMSCDMRDVAFMILP